MELAFVSMEVAGVAFFAAIWAASAGWAVRDAGRRCADPSLRVAAAAATVLLPLAGAALYLLVRPGEERLDVTARRLRLQLLQRAFAEPATTCVACRGPVEADFRCCPRCSEPLRRACNGCGGLVRLAWSACPWCTTPLDLPGESLSEVA